MLSGGDEVGGDGGGGGGGGGGGSGVLGMSACECLILRECTKLPPGTWHRTLGKTPTQSERMVYEQTPARGSQHCWVYCSKRFTLLLIKTTCS